MCTRSFAEMRPAAFAGGAVLVAVVVATLVFLWPGDHRNAPPPSPDPPPSLAAQFPPPPAAPVPPPLLQAVQDGDDVAAVGEGRPALCDGCLTERAVLDVVDTYLRHLDPVYLQGERWAHPLADVAPDPPDRIRLPKLPEGLLDAPELNPFGMTVDSRDYPVETTWIVWIQTGWVPRRAIERRIRRTSETTIAEMRANEPLDFDALQTALKEAAPGTVLPDDYTIRTSTGDLSEVALSWPPIKKEVFVAVDGRTGRLYPDGIFLLTSHGQVPPFPPHYEEVLDATRQRVARWLRGGGGELGSSS